MEFKTPILFIVFNRPDLTLRVLSCLKELKPVNLYISMDGPRSGNQLELENCAKVKLLINESIDWKCNLRLNFIEENLGPRGGPCKAYEWFFNSEDAGIILEDDSLPNLSFFVFASKLLEYYKNDDRVFSINGNNFGYQNPKHESYGFTRFMSAWGWATWKRSYELVDYNLTFYHKMWFPRIFLFLKLNKLNDFDLGWVNHWYEVLKIIFSDNKQYWDYQWMLTQVYYKRYSIFPSQNLVSNIGFDSLGTNLRDRNDPMANLDTFNIQGPLIHPEKMKIDNEYEKRIIKPIWRYYKNRLGLKFYIKNVIYKAFRKIRLVS